MKGITNMFKSITRTRGRAALALFTVMTLICAVTSMIVAAHAQTETVFDNMGAGTVTDSDGFIDSPEGSETVSGLVGVDSATDEPRDTTPGTQASPMDSATDTSAVDDGDTSSLAGIIIAIVIVIAVIIIVVALVPKKKQ